MAIGVTPGGFVSTPGGTTSFGTGTGGVIRSSGGGGGSSGGDSFSIRDGSVFVNGVGSSVSPENLAAFIQQQGGNISQARLQQLQSQLNAQLQQQREAATAERVAAQKAAVAEKVAIERKKIVELTARLKKEGANTRTQFAIDKETGDRIRFDTITNTARNNERVFIETNLESGGSKTTRTFERVDGGTVQMTGGIIETPPQGILDPLDVGRLGGEDDTDVSGIGRSEGIVNIGVPIITEKERRGGAVGLVVPTTINLGGSLDQSQRFINSGSQFIQTSPRVAPTQTKEDIINTQAQIFAVESGLPLDDKASLIKARGFFEGLPADQKRKAKILSVDTGIKSSLIGVAEFGVTAISKAGVQKFNSPDEFGKSTDVKFGGRLGDVRNQIPLQTTTTFLESPKQFIKEKSSSPQVIAGIGTTTALIGAGGFGAVKNIKALGFKGGTIETVGAFSPLKIKNKIFTAPITERSPIKIESFKLDSGKDTLRAIAGKGTETPFTITSKSITSKTTGAGVQEVDVFQPAFTIKNGRVVEGTAFSKSFGIIGKGIGGKPSLTLNDAVKVKLSKFKGGISDSASQQKFSGFVADNLGILEINKPSRIFKKTKTAGISREINEGVDVVGFGKRKTIFEVTKDDTGFIRQPSKRVKFKPTITGREIDIGKVAGISDVGEVSGIKSVSSSSRGKTPLSKTFQEATTKQEISNIQSSLNTKNVFKTPSTTKPTTTLKQVTSGVGVQRMIGGSGLTDAQIQRGQSRVGLDSQSQTLTSILSVGQTKQSFDSVSKTDTKLKNLLKTQSETKIKQRTKQQSKQLLFQKSKLKTIQKQRTGGFGGLGFGSGTPRPPKVPKEIIVPPFKLKRGKKKPTSKGLFGVEVRRRGKFKTIGTGLSLKQATSIGQQRVGSTLAATFRVTPIKNGGVGNAFKTPVGFRRKETKVGTLFIERRGRRLSTGTEIGEIQRSKRRLKF